MIDRNDVIAANSAVTASENFAGETVVIHFERGTYFSFRGSAGAIWSLLQTPTSIADIVETVRALQGPAPTNFEATLTEFVARLAEYGLIAGCSGAAARPTLSADAAASLAEPAELEVYSDLAELIAMDPVHEVDIFTGWPQRVQPVEQNS